MDWTDDAITLGARAHGEGSAIVTLLTKSHGLHMGHVRGARSKRLAPALQAGSLVEATWRARLNEHLGAYTIETKKIHAHEVMSLPLELAALASICAVAAAALPERENHPALYEGLLILLENLCDRSIWPAVRVKWEIGLLKELGYGLELEKCAVTGQAVDLTHVSPRSGRAVCASEAAPYADKLLPLPGYLTSDRDSKTTAQDALDGLALSGFFMQRRLFSTLHKELPEARSLFIERLARIAKEGGKWVTDAPDANLLIRSYE